MSLVITGTSWGGFVPMLCCPRWSIQAQNCSRDVWVWKKMILQRTRTIDTKSRLTSCFCINDVRDRYLAEVLKRSLSMPLCSRYCYANISNHYRKNLSCLYRAFQFHLHSSTHLYQFALPSRQIHYHHPALPAAPGLVLLLGEAVRRGPIYRKQ